MQCETTMSDEALIAYIAGRLEALLAYTGKDDDGVSSMCCDLTMFRRECNQLREMCFRQLEKKDGKDEA